jgi:uncharacterized membrane protein (Fun14 family)
MNGTNNTYLAKNVNEEEALTPLQLSWNSYMSIANMIPNLGMLLLNATIGHKIPMRPRLVVSLIGIIILFIVTDAMTRVNTDGFQDGFLVVTLGTVVLITACVGILQVSIAFLKQFSDDLLYRQEYLILKEYIAMFIYIVTIKLFCRVV